VSLSALANDDSDEVEDVYGESILKQSTLMFDYVS
jgi:hypothetical protein